MVMHRSTIPKKRSTPSGTNAPFSRYAMPADTLCDRLPPYFLYEVFVHMYEDVVHMGEDAVHVYEDIVQKLWPI